MGKFDIITKISLNFFYITMHYIFISFFYVCLLFLITL